MRYSVDDKRPPNDDFYSSVLVKVFHHSEYLGKAYLSEGLTWVFFEGGPNSKSITHWELLEETPESK